MSSLIPSIISRHPEKIKTLLSFALVVACWGIAWGVGIDFYVYHHAGTLALQDPNLIYSTPARTGGYFYYGPVFLIATLPLGLLSFKLAKIVWIICLTLLLYAIVRGLNLVFPQLKNSFGSWLVLFVFSIASIHSGFQSLNIQIILFAMLLYAELWVDSKEFKWQWLSGVLVGLASMIKVFPLFIFVFYFIKKNNTVRLGLLSGIVLGFLLPMVFFGVDGLNLWKSFFYNLFHYESRNSQIQYSYMLSLPALIRRYGYYLAWNPGTVKAVTYSVILILSSLFFWRSYKSQDTRKNWALGLALMVLINPTSMPHYFIFFLPLVGFLIEKNQHATRLFTYAFATFWILVCFTTDAFVGRTANTFLESYGFITLAYLGLCGIFFYDNQKTAHS